MTPGRTPLRSGQTRNTSNWPNLTHAPEKIFKIFINPLVPIKVGLLSSAMSPFRPIQIKFSYIIFLVQEAIFTIKIHYKI